MAGGTQKSLFASKAGQNYGSRDFFPEPISSDNVDSLRSETVSLKYRKRQFLWISPDPPRRIVERNFQETIWLR